MNENKSKIKVSFRDYLKIDSVLKQLGQYFNHEDNIRTHLGIALSVLIHGICILSFMGLSHIKSPEEPPIREITFIDMNDAMFQKKKTATKKAVQRQIKKQEPQQLKPVEKIEPEVAVASSKIDLNRKNRFPVDEPRRQAPISIERHASISGASSLNNQNDILKISPANNGTAKKRLVVGPSIDLASSKKITLASTVKNPVNFESERTIQPKIDLTKKSIGVESNKPIALENNKLPQKPAEKSKSFAALNQAQTFIAGPLGSRQILHKKIPAFPLWAKRKGVGATVSLRFTVMENGKVKENILVERTSGSGEWDKMVIQSLKEWLFKPLENTDKRFDQTGVITFQFVI